MLIGKVTKYFSRLNVAEIAVEASDFSLGDRLLITGPTTGVMYVTATEIHDDNGPVTHAPQHIRVSVPVEGKVRPNDKVFKRVKVEGNN